MPIPQVGDTPEFSPLLTQAHFDRFADLSGDDNPIHVDPAFCAGTRFGRPVAHGMLLFGILDAATSRWLNEPLALWKEELTFRAPTFADDDLTATLTLESRGAGGIRVGQWLRRSDGTETAAGHAIVGYADQPDATIGSAAAPPGDSAELFGIRPGMRATTRRTISAADVATFCRLVDNRNPRYADHGSIPPPLLGGLVSYLLGVELPGRGTNWLRHRYTFHHPAAAGRAIESTVEVTRVSPEKALVNLSTASVVDGRTAVTGEALVLISDLERGASTDQSDAR